MRLVFAGTPSAAVPSLEAIAASDHELVAVLTRPDAPSGRGRRAQPSPVKVAAMALDLPVLEAASLRSDDMVAQLADLAPDACPVVAYGVLIPERLLDLPTHGWINLHFSLLPAWRGAAPVQHAVLNGDETTGASTFQIEAGLDTGPVYGMTTEPIGPRDTAGDLLDRLAHSGAQLLLRTLDAVENGTARPQPQQAEGVSLAPKITADDARVRWHHPALAVDRRIRACTPAPGAWSDLVDGERRMRIGFGPIDGIVADGPALAPGRLAVGKHDVLVGTGSVPVRLGTVAPPGKRMMAAADWARGARLGGDAHFAG